MKQGELYERDVSELEAEIEELKEIRDNDTVMLQAILNELESEDYDIQSICSWIRDELEKR